MLCPERWTAPPTRRGCLMMPKMIRIALRNLTRSRRRTIITVAALTVGVGIMVVIHGLTNGYQSALLSSIVQTYTGAIQIHRKGYLENVQALPLTLDIADTPSLRENLLSVPG